MGKPVRTCTVGSILARNMRSPSFHELLWLSCAAKRCCSVRTVLPTGGDVWRIATQLQVPPDSFLRTIPAEPGAEDGVLLEPNGRRVHVVLARRALKGRQAACVFLMQLRDEVARCGLGDLRPLSCQAWPAVWATGAVRLDANHVCTCRAWSLADMDREAARLLLEQEAAEREVDRRIIAEWNVQVEAAPHPTYRLTDYCDYLMRAYSVRMSGTSTEGAA